MVTKSKKGVDYISQKYGVVPPDLSVNTDILFSIFDVCQNQFLPPFPAPTIDSAKRSICDLVSGNPKSLMAKYPTDYHLYKLAEWNCKTGYISIDIPKKLCSVYSIISNSKLFVVSSDKCKEKGGDKVEFSNKV